MENPPIINNCSGLTKPEAQEWLIETRFTYMSYVSHTYNISLGRAFDILKEVSWDISIIYPETDGKTEVSSNTLCELCYENTAKNRPCGRTSCSGFVCSPCMNIWMDTFNRFDCPFCIQHILPSAVDKHIIDGKHLEILLTVISTITMDEIPPTCYNCNRLPPNTELQHQECPNCEIIICKCGLPYHSSFEEIYSCYNALNAYNAWLYKREHQLKRNFLHLCASIDYNANTIYCERCGWTKRLRLPTYNDIIYAAVAYRTLFNRKDVDKLIQRFGPSLKSELFWAAIILRYWSNTMIKSSNEALDTLSDMHYKGTKLWYRYICLV